MGSIIHFEIPSDHPKKSISFYEKVFNWKFEKWGKEDFWIIKTGGDKDKGIDGGLIKKNEFQRVVINTINVKNLDKTAEKIVEHGGEIILDKTAIKGIGWLLYFKDLDGNVFGAMEEDKNA